MMDETSSDPKVHDNKCSSTSTCSLANSTSHANLGNDGGSKSGESANNPSTSLQQDASIITTTQGDERSAPSKTADIVDSSRIGPTPDSTSTLQIEGSENTSAEKMGMLPDSKPALVRIVTELPSDKSAKGSVPPVDQGKESNVSSNISPVGVTDSIMPKKNGTESHIESDFPKKSPAEKEPSRVLKEETHQLSSPPASNPGIIDTSATAPTPAATMTANGIPTDSSACSVPNIAPVSKKDPGSTAAAPTATISANGVPTANSIYPVSNIAPVTKKEGSNLAPMSSTPQGRIVDPSASFIGASSVSNTAAAPPPPIPFHQESKSVGFMQPQDNDVLFGRGGGTNFHQGNINYRKMIKNQQQAYINARQRSVKTQIISQIIQEVRQQTPSGRFVKFDDRIKLWFEVDEKEVKKKTSQTLREGAPQWRKAHGEWKRRDEDGPKVKNEEASTKRGSESLESASGEGPYSDVVRADKARNPAKKAKKEASKDSSSDPSAPSGLDLLSHAISTLHPGASKNKVKQGTNVPPTPPISFVDPAAEALRKWREDNKHALDRTSETNPPSLPA